MDGHYDLSDKELAVLFNYIGRNGAHILVLSDSCHSGSLLKGKDLIETSEWTKRFCSNSIKNRPIDQYLYDQELEELIQNGRKDIEYIHQYYHKLDPNEIAIPQASQVLLSACNERESAWEVAGSGIFTTAVLEVLANANRPISYFELYNNCLIQMRNSTNKQTPQLEVFGHFNANQSFIEGQDLQYSPFRKVYHQNGAWKTAIGASYGFPLDLSKSIKLDIYADDEGKHAVARGIIRSIGFDNSNISRVILQDKTQPLDKEQIYWARLKDTSINPMFIGFEGEAADKKLLEDLLQKQFLNMLSLSDSKTSQFYIAWDEEEEMYKLWERNRPIYILGIPDWDLETLEVLIKRLKHLFEWQNVIDLQNPKTEIPKNDIALDFYELDVSKRPYEQHNIAGDSVRVISKYNEASELWEKINYGLRATNNSNHMSYYCACLIVSEDYGVHISLNPQQLKPNQNIELIDPSLGAFILLNREENIAINYIKVILSTDPILSIASFELPDLRIGEDIQMGKFKGAVARGSMRSDWRTKMITVEINRELPEQISTADTSVGNSDLVIKGHEFFTAQIKLPSFQPHAKNVDGILGLNQLFKDAEGVDLVSLNELSSDRAKSLDANYILELSNIENEQSLKENPLEIQLPKPTDDTYILPITFNGEQIELLGDVTEIPEQDKLSIQINSIPNQEQNNQKGLFKALKMAFLKVILKKNTTDLRWVEYLYSGKIIQHKNGLKEKVAKANKIILLVHGIAGNTQEMAKAFRFANDDNHLILTFDYENLNTPIEETAKHLAWALQEAGLDKKSTKEVTIIAHSMGGLVSRVFIEDPQLGGEQIVNKLILCGVPNGGFIFGNLPAYRNYLYGLLAIGLNFTKSYLPWIAGVYAFVNGLKKLTGTLAQLKSDSNLIKGLYYADAKPQNTQYHIIAGDVMEYNPKQEKWYQRMLDHALLKVWKFGYAKAPNDIAVSVESAQKLQKDFVPTSVSEIICHHLNYFSNPASLAQIKAILQNSYTSYKPLTVDISAKAVSKILFIAASPMDTVQLQSGREYRLLKAMLRQGTKRDLYQILEPQFAVTIPDLIRASKAQPQLIHFSGHSTVGGITIDDGQGFSAPLPLAALQRLLSPISANLNSLILNGCFSTALAKEISILGCYVIGHDLEVSDESAIRFTEGFYASLGEGAELEVAYSDALVAAHEISDVVSVWKDGEKLDW